MSRSESQGWKLLFNNISIALKKRIDCIHCLFMQLFLTMPTPYKCTSSTLKLPYPKCHLLKMSTQKMTAFTTVLEIAFR